MKYHASPLDRLALYSRSFSMNIARPLDIIADIEAMERDIRIEILALSDAICAGEKIIHFLAEITVTIPHFLIEELEQHQEKLRNRYNYLKNNKKAITALCAEHDELPDLLDDAIFVLRKAFKQAEKLRWEAFEHNTDLAPKGESRILSTPEEIERELSDW